MNNQLQDHHYSEALQDTDAPFDHYEPAYRYGYALAIDPAYNSRLWTEVEPEVRAYYKTEYADGRLPWEHYRAAVSHAWDYAQPLKRAPLKQQR